MLFYYAFLILFMRSLKDFGLLGHTALPPSLITFSFPSCPTKKNIKNIPNVVIFLKKKLQNKIYTKAKRINKNSIWGGGREAEKNFTLREKL